MGLPRPVYIFRGKNHKLPFIKIKFFAKLLYCSASKLAVIYIFHFRKGSVNCPVTITVQILLYLNNTMTLLELYIFQVFPQKIQ